EAAALESAVLSNWSHYSSVASTSAGVELFCNAIVVMGNSASAAGDNIIGHSVMRDALDLRGVLEAFHSVGFDAASVLSGEAGARVLN
ncbi:ring-opening amidohydrolase, partial [Staphylococcus shinii]|uniref:ring-opening amidohydrolase n=1 Tax=Staphylococcus shinii TaxID=2912228 RepID=UPI003F456849